VHNDAITPCSTTGCNHFAVHIGLLQNTRGVQKAHSQEWVFCSPTLPLKGSGQNHVHAELGMSTIVPATLTEQSLAIYRELALPDVADEYEAAMRTFPIQ
jgi:hypothetical protein